MQPAIKLKYDPKFAIADLTFLLGTSQPDLLNQLLLREHQFYTFVNVWNERSDLHLNKLQPKLENAGFVDGKYEKRKFDEALGPALRSAMIRLTDDAVELNDIAIRSIEDFSKKFTNELKRLFPKERFIALHTVENEKRQDNESSLSHLERP